MKERYAVAWRGELTGWVEFKVLLQVGMPEVALLLCENQEGIIELDLCCTDLGVHVYNHVVTPVRHSGGFELES
jgi:hypothetical protein